MFQRPCRVKWPQQMLNKAWFSLATQVQAQEPLLHRETGLMQAQAQGSK